MCVQPFQIRFAHSFVAPFLRLYNTTIPYRIQLRFYAFKPYFMGFAALRIPQRVRLKRLALVDSYHPESFQRDTAQNFEHKKCPAADFSTTGQYLSHFHANSRLKPDFKAILFHNNLVNKPLKQFVVIFRQRTQQFLGGLDEMIKAACRATQFDPDHPDPFIFNR